MRLHFATVPIHDGAAAEEELNRFLATHRVVAIERQFVANGDRSAWAVCVSWVTTPGREEGAAGDGRKARTDYRELLSAEEFAVFVKLREARKALAERDAVPPYADAAGWRRAALIRRPPVDA